MLLRRMRGRTHAATSAAAAAAATTTSITAAVIGDAAIAVACGPEFVE